MRPFKKTRSIGRRRPTAVSRCWVRSCAPRVSRACAVRSLCGSTAAAASRRPPALHMLEDVAEAVWGAHELSERTVVEELVIRPMQGDI